MVGDYELASEWQEPAAQASSPVIAPDAPAAAELKVGDAVALADPYMVAYTYHGIVEEVTTGDDVLVRWAERQGKANETERYHASELRLLE